MDRDRPERERYRRASWAEQATDAIDGLRSHPGVVAFLLIAVAGWAFLVFTTPQALRVGELRPGDCVYIHAADAEPGVPGARQTGSDGGVVAALYAEGAERAGCDASHGHEVIATLVAPESQGTPYPGATALAAAHAAACDAAFADRVGGTAADQGLAMIVAVPPPGSWDDGQRTVVCLAGRADGQFLSGPLRRDRP